MSPQLEYIGLYRATLGPKETTLPLGPVKGQGTHRIIAPVSGGFIKTSSFSALVLPGGVDWALVDPSAGTAYLDARVSARTSEGEMIYAHYTGVIKLDEEAQKFFDWSPEARTTESREHYFVSAPIFEVSSERLKWM